MFFDVYKKLCEEHNVTCSRAALDMGINKGTVSVWKKKGTSPQAAQLQKIAEYFGVSGDKQLPATVNCSVGDNVSLYAEITEDDSVPDTGWWDGYVTIEDGDFETGFTVTEDVYVYETSGRYSGNEAKFEVVWDFEPQ